MKKKTVGQYIKEYNVPDQMAMIRNNRLDPKICSDTCSDKLVVITGATSGIGHVTARKYASQGASLLCINRNLEKSQALKTEIEAEFGVPCDFRIVDLSILQEVRRLAEELKQLPTPIDVLIHNAGVYLTRKEVTPDGFEKVFMVHYLSSFMINLWLLDKLKSQERARIILVSSEAHRFAAWGLRVDDLNWEKRRYSGLKGYGSAKLAQLLSMIIYADYCKGTGVTINAMHPGAVKTGTGQENGPVYRWFKRNFLDRNLRPAEISAEALYYLGVSRDMEGICGKFFNLTQEEIPAPPALDKGAAYELWEKSLAYVDTQESMFT
jgi:NAD(P)-dependent dehydrogenase (short-subunit alcohol dehydrogenase family)